MDRADKANIRDMTRTFFKSYVYISIMNFLVIAILVYLMLTSEDLQVGMIIFGVIIALGVSVYLFFSLRSLILLIKDRNEAAIEEAEGYLSHVVPDLLHEASFIMKDKTYIGLKFREDQKTKYRSNYDAEFVFRKGTKVKLYFLKRTKTVIDAELLEDWSKEAYEAFAPMMEKNNQVEDDD